MKKNIVSEDRFSDRMGALNDPDVDFDLGQHNANVMRKREADRRLQAKEELQRVSSQLQKFKTDMREAMMLNARLLQVLDEMNKNVAELDTDEINDVLGKPADAVVGDYWAYYVLAADDIGTGYEMPNDFGFVYSRRLNKTDIGGGLIMAPHNSGKHPGCLGVGSDMDDMNTLEWVYAFNGEGSEKFGEQYAVGARLIDLVDPRVCKCDVVPDIYDVLEQAQEMLSKIGKFLDEYHSYSGRIVDYVLKAAKYVKAHALTEGRFASLVDKLKGFVEEGRFADLEDRIPRTLSESRKVTLTVGQLKKIVVEARNEILRGRAKMKR